MTATSDKHHTFLPNPWWTMGLALPGKCGLCINETASRARIGQLNVLSGTTIFMLLSAP